MVLIIRRVVLVCVGCLLAILLSSQLSYAQQASEAPATTPAAAPATGPGAPIGNSSGAQKGGAKGAPKKTSINFEDQLIEGQAQKPELFYMLQQQNKNFKRLIQLRENFLPEMRKTSEDVVRKGAGT